MAWSRKNCGDKMEDTSAAVVDFAGARRDQNLDRRRLASV